MNPKLSVIVPVYGVEKYIHECLESLAKQDYEPIEFILIDDGTPDKSAQICDEFAQKDDRFLVVHKKNSGVSDARNIGIDIADGQYITFVDSDDVLVGNPYAFLVDQLQKNDADIATMGCSSFIIGDDAQSKKEERNTEFVDSEQLCSALLEGRMCAIWDKVFKRSILAEQRSDCGIRNEDFLFLIKLAFFKDLKIISTNCIGYYYRPNQESITSRFDVNMIDAVRNAEFAYEKCPYEKVKGKALDYLLFRSLMFYIGMPRDYLENHHADCEYVLQIIKKKYGKSKSSLSRKYRALLQLIRFSPGLAKRLLDLYMKIKA